MNEFVVSVNDKKQIVNLISSEKVELDGKEYGCELLHLSGNTYILKLDNEFYEISSDRINNGSFSLTIEGNIYEVTIKSALQEKASQLLQKSGTSQNKIDVKAPMPGMILKVNKKLGDHIKKGETIIILEAMKMENDLRAPKSGTIKDIFVNEGTAVEKGFVLLAIE